ncbi:hypothetical protein ACFL06_00180 [Patescibacteria group bacterium]
MERREEKEKVVLAIVRGCIGNRGVWADSSGRYKDQCWTRDFVLAAMPTLLDLGEHEAVRNHLINLSRRQRENGQIPILFLDRTFPFLLGKASRTLRNRRVSFMLRRFLEGQLWNLTPGTKDSEILYLIGMQEYARSTGDWGMTRTYASQTRKALLYIETRLMKDGLVSGCDWRDTMEKELGGETLLTNNALLHQAYRLLGETEKAEMLRWRINERFWTGSTYLDYLSNRRFDPLGAAFAVLYGIASREQYKSLAESFQRVNTHHGVTIWCRHNATSSEEAEVIEHTNGVVVWPFVVGFSILALLQMGQMDLATDQFKKLVGLNGFQEWYDPATGRGWGASEQLWSAALFLRASSVIGFL